MANLNSLKKQCLIAERFSEIYRFYWGDEDADLSVINKVVRKACVACSEVDRSIIWCRSGPDPKKWMVVTLLPEDGLTGRAGQ